MILNTLFVTLTIGLMSRESVRQWSTRSKFIPSSSNTKDSKMVLGTALFNTQYGSRVNLIDPGNRVAPFPYTSVL